MAWICHADPRLSFVAGSFFCARCCGIYGAAAITYAFGDASRLTRLARLHLRLVVYTALAGFVALAVWTSIQVPRGALSSNYSRFFAGMGVGAALGVMAALAVSRNTYSIITPRKYAIVYLAGGLIALATLPYVPAPSLVWNALSASGLVALIGYPSLMLIRKWLPAWALRSPAWLVASSIATVEIAIVATVKEYLMAL